MSEMGSEGGIFDWDDSTLGTKVCARGRVGVDILGELKIRRRLDTDAGNETADGCVLLLMPVAESRL